MPPGPAVAGFLASIDVDRVSGHDRVVVLRAQQRMASHYQAKVYAAMASIADHMDDDLFADDPALAWDATSTEIRAALRLTRRAAETELDRACELRRRLPRVWQAMAEGRIDRRRASVLIDGTSGLDEAAADRVLDRIIEEAPGLTTGELASRLRHLAVVADPDAAAARYHQAVDDRRVVMEPSPDGTAHLAVYDVEPDRAMEASRRIDAIARSLDRSQDSRTLDQIRADVFIDLLCGTAEHPRRGSIDLHVDLETLARLADTPGDLAGYGPVVADIARQVASAQVDGEWRFTISDPTTGLPVHDGTTRRRPTVAQRRSVEARDRVCTFPGCRIPARQCDIDHRIPWSRRRVTDTAGLDAACRYDHVTVRHGIGWRHHLLPGGDHLWISPLGHRYTKSGRPP